MRSLVKSEIFKEVILFILFNNKFLSSKPELGKIKIRLPKTCDLEDQNRITENVVTFSTHKSIIDLLDLNLDLTQAILPKTAPANKFRESRCTFRVGLLFLSFVIFCSSANYAN